MARARREALTAADFERLSCHPAANPRGMCRNEWDTCRAPATRPDELCDDCRVVLIAEEEERGARIARRVHRGDETSRLVSTV